MYRIMLVAKESANKVNSLYKYFTITNPKGTVIPYEATTLEELEAQVEEMLNGDYRKKDILVVQEFGFDVLANLDETKGESSDEDGVPVVE